jgi:hypothetical protein
MGMGVRIHKAGKQGCAIALDHALVRTRLGGPSAHCCDGCVRDSDPARERLLSCRRHHQHVTEDAGLRRHRISSIRSPRVARRSR